MVRAKDTLSLHAEIMTTTEIATEPEESKKAKRVRKKGIPLHGREFGLQLDVRAKSPPWGDSSRGLSEKGTNPSM